MYLHIYTYIYVYIYIYIYIHIYMYTYMYIHTRIYLYLELFTTLVLSGDANHTSSHIATCCITWPHLATPCNTLQHTAYLIIEEISTVGSNWKTLLVFPTPRATHIAAVVLKRPKHSKETHHSKETYFFQKRPILFKRDLYLSTETHTACHPCSCSVLNIRTHSLYFNCICVLNFEMYLNILVFEY